MPCHNIVDHITRRTIMITITDFLHEKEDYEVHRIEPQNRGEDTNFEITCRVEGNDYWTPSKSSGNTVCVGVVFMPAQKGEKTLQFEKTERYKQAKQQALQAAHTRAETKFKLDKLRRCIENLNTTDARERLYDIAVASFTEAGTGSRRGDSHRRLVSGVRIDGGLVDILKRLDPNNIKIEHDPPVDRDKKSKAASILKQIEDLYEDLSDELGYAVIPNASITDMPAKFSKGGPPPWMLPMMLGGRGW